MEMGPIFNTCRTFEHKHQKCLPNVKISLVHAFPTVTLPRSDSVERRSFSGGILGLSDFVRFEIYPIASLTDVENTIYMRQ